MYLHELRPYQGLALAVTNTETGNIVILTTEGAVFNNENTDDLRNMSPAFGALFDSNWRIATMAEVLELRERDTSDQIMTFDWSKIPEPKHPHLRLVQ